MTTNYKNITDMINTINDAGGNFRYDSARGEYPEILDLDTRNAVYYASALQARNACTRLLSRISTVSPSEFWRVLCSCGVGITARD